MWKLYRNAILLTFCCLLNVSLTAQIYPADFAQVLVANGIANPTVMAFAPDGRIFVAEQGGRLRVIKNGALLPTPFVQLSVSSSGERGLIGITLDPEFTSNHYVYLYYTVPGSPPHNRVSRFTANGDVVQTGSEFVVLELDPLSNATNHNGGAMSFGKDGKLYVAVGENANSSYAQNLDTYHGKLLRINKDGSVPEGNPFTTGSEQRRRIWSYGLRNPYTFSIHPQTGQILVNDVGQVTWEEINDASAAGRNFGWPTTEGTFNASSYPNLTNPIYAYSHGGGDGKGCAIAGGIFFNPSVTNYPAAYWGRYFFQDYCNRWINTLDLTGPTAVRSSFATALSASCLSLTVGNDGNLYYLSRSAGALFKIIYNKTTTPYITEHPQSLTIAEGQDAIFSVSSLGSTPMQFQWQKNSADIEGAISPELTINGATPADAGVYMVAVTNAAGAVTSNSASLIVIENTPPTAGIVVPLEGSTYVAGADIQFSGTGNDEEDGELPPEVYSWQIDFHHDTHHHDQPPVDAVTAGSFSVPDQGETSPNVWYKITLTVTDSKGLIGKDEVEIFPEKSTISLATDPAGLEVVVDGQSVATPTEIISVVGMKRTFSVSTPQINEDVEFQFESWSNDGEMTQTIPTPAGDLTLIAKFANVVGTENTFINDCEVVIYPNPSGDEYCMVELIVKQQSDVSMQLVNVLSQEIYTSTNTLPQGKHQLPLYVRDGSKGLHYVIVKVNGSRIVKKLIVGE